MKPTDNRQLKMWMSTIIFAIVLFAAVNNLDAIAGFFDGFLGTFSSLGLGFALALILNVPLRGMERLLKKIDKKHRLSEKARNIICLLTVFLSAPLILIAIVAFILPEFISAIDGLISSINRNQTEILAFAAKFGLDTKTIQDVISEISIWINTNMRSLLNITMNTAVSIVSGLTNGVMCVILAIYILADRKRISSSTRKILFAFLPKKIAAFISRTCSMFVATFSRFLSMQCLEAFILAAILFVGMTILRLPYAVSISCLTMVLALIPYIGAYVSLIFGAVLILLESPSGALVFLILFTLVQQIEGNVIYPRVVGESVGLPAYITLMAVTVGGAVWDIPGMMLFVPIASVIYTLMDEAVKKRLPDAIDDLCEGESSADSTPQSPEKA